MPQILTEYIPLVLTPQQLLEAADSSQGNASMILKRILLQKKDTENRNGRVYPGPVLEREINKYNDTMVKTRRALGELDHRNDMVVHLGNVSHLITEMWWEDDSVYGNIEILDTDEFPSGRIAAGLLRRKIPVGISSRALGSVTEVNGKLLVNEDLALSCFDLVSYESTIGSNMSLNEGMELKVGKYDRFDSIIYDILCNTNGHCPCKK